MKKKRTNRSKQAGLQFPVGRLQKYLRQQNIAPRISPNAAVYLAAILEYTSAEILELAGNKTRENKRKRINPRHILLAIKNDAEFELLLRKVVIPEGGILPHPQYVKEKEKKSEPPSENPICEIEEEKKEEFKYPAPDDLWPDLVKKTKELYGIVSFTILESENPKQTIIVMGERHDLRDPSSTDCSTMFATYAPDYILKLFEMKNYFFDLFLEVPLIIKNKKLVRPSHLTSGSRNINYLTEKLFSTKKSRFENLRTHAVDVRQNLELKGWQKVIRYIQSFFEAKKTNTITRTDLEKKIGDWKLEIGSMLKERSENQVQKLLNVDENSLIQKEINRICRNKSFTVTLQREFHEQLVAKRKKAVDLYTTLNVFTNRLLTALESKSGKFKEHNEIKKILGKFVRYEQDLLDMYTIARIFHTFNPKKKSTFPSSAKNAIVYVGNAHARTIVNILLSLNFFIVTFPDVDMPDYWEKEIFRT